MVRRKPGTLLPIEEAILGAGVDLSRAGSSEFHGFLVAKELRDKEGARSLTAHGTLYKALDRLERMGLVASRWENPDDAAADGRPRRRLYHVTGAGARAAATARATATDPSWRPSPGAAPA